MFCRFAFGTIVGVTTGISSLAAAQAPVSVPASRPAATPPTTQQATTPPAAAEPRVHDVLQKLERRKVDDLSSSIEWQVLDEVIQDVQRKIGTLLFKREKPRDRFFVRFDKTIVEDQEINKPEEHLFDGEWYIEKRDATKTIIRRQILRPGEEGYDPFKLGEGPFPLPFGQKEAEILDKFDVTYVETAQGDPENTAHLKLVPKASSGDLHEKYEVLHFYVDRKMDLPVKVIARQKDDKTVTVYFRDIKINSSIPGSRFTIELPKNDPTWEEHVESLPPEDPTAGPAK